MKRRGLRVSGANGALPIWKAGVEGIVKEGLLGRPSGEPQPFVPKGFREKVYGILEEGKDPKSRLMPVAEESSFVRMSHRQLNGHH